MSPRIADTAAIRPDAWLTAVLGFPVYAVDAGAEPGEHEGRALWFAKVDAERTDDVARLEERGFRVVDVNVRLRHDGSPARTGSSVDVGPATPDEHEHLVAIAGGCFRYSRFHLDPLLPDELADRIKAEWVRSYAEGRRGIELLAARDGGRPVGFLAVLESGDARVIDLIGVERDAQRRGAGSALVAAFVERHGDRAGELAVGTQVANGPSLRLYAGHGFEVAGASYVLHRHAGAP